MRKMMLVVSVLMLAVTACSSPKAQATEPPVVTVEPVTTQSLSAEPAATQPQAAPTDLPASQPPGGTIVYQIVPGESQLKYEVYETFINDNNRLNLAVGTTPQVTGEVQIDPAAPANSTLGEITADISQFQSDSSRRDNALRDRFIESARYPDVTFVAQSIEGLPTTYQEGEQLVLKISGELTIREVTKPVTFDVTVMLEGDTLSGEAVTTILMSDFGFGPISIGGILNTEDEAKVTLTFVARP
jgi:polyisoprenoid-binding protein YceI